MVFDDSVLSGPNSVREASEFVLRRAGLSEVPNEVIDRKILFLVRDFKGVPLLLIGKITSVVAHNGRVDVGVHVPEVNLYHSSGENEVFGSLRWSEGGGWQMVTLNPDSDFEVWGEYTGELSIL